MSNVAQSCPTLCDPMDGGYQAPPSMGFPSQEYRNGLPFPSSGGRPDPGIEPRSPALQVDALSSVPPGNTPSSKPVPGSSGAEHGPGLRALPPRWSLTRDHGGRQHAVAWVTRPDSGWSCAAPHESLRGASQAGSPAPRILTARLFSAQLGIRRQL